MKDVLLYITQAITEYPDQLIVEEKESDSQVDFYISCATTDAGKIIGKKGRIIKSIRRVLSIIALREGKRVNITMVDKSGNSLSSPEEKPESQN